MKSMTNHRPARATIAETVRRDTPFVAAALLFVISGLIIGRLLLLIGP